MKIVTFIRVLILVFIWLLGNLGVYGQTQNLDFRFKHYSAMDGLPSTIINGAVQDEMGNWWFSAEGGLTKYDGFEFKVFSFDPNDPNSIPPDRLYRVFKLYNGNLLFFLDKGGFFLFDPKSEKATMVDSKIRKINDGIVASDSSLWICSKADGIIHLSKNLEVLDIYHSSDKVKTGDLNGICISEDSQGFIWVGGDFGLIKMNEKGVVKHYLTQKIEDGQTKAISKILNGIPKEIIEIDNNQLWISFGEGLAYFDKSTESFEHFLSPSFHGHNSQTQIIISAIFYYNNTIWCGTRAEGIYLFDLKTRKFVKNIVQGKYNPHELQSNTVDAFYSSDLYPDGVLWINTPIALTKVNLEQKAFQLYSHFPEDESSIRFNAIRAIYKEGDKLWIGSDGTDGLDIINTITGDISSYKSDLSDPHSIGNGRIGGIVKRTDGKYWISTWSGYLNLFDPDTGEFEKWKAYHNDIGLDQGWVFSNAAADTKGNLYLGSLDNGIHVISESPLQETRFFPALKSNSPNDITDNNTREIFTDNQSPAGVLWFGTQSGLSRYDSESDIWKHYLTDLTQYPSLACNSILGIYRDKNGFFWLGMEGCGLVRLNIETQEIKVYTINDGLSSNIVNALYADKNENLWLSTGNGITKFDPQKETFQIYTYDDGLQGNQFNWGAHFQDEDGIIYFGGANGVTAFDPLKIKANPYIAYPIIRGIDVMNQRVLLGDTIHNKIPLQLDEEGNQELQIHYFNNEIKIHFASTHYANPLSIKYQYMLEGYNDDWIEASKDNPSVNFANLPAGTYSFKLKASNNDGLWNEDYLTMKVVVYPPWWNTWWFKLLVSVIIMIGGIMIYRKRVAQFKLDKKLLEEEVSKATSQVKSRNEELQVQQESLRSAIEDTNFVMKEAIESGKFSARINTDSKEGEWRVLGDSVNKLFESIMEPFGGINQVIDAMAKGDLTVRYTKESKGDIKALTDNLNTALDSLSNLLKDISLRVSVIGSSSEEMSITVRTMNLATSEISSAIAQMSSGAHRQLSQVDKSSGLIEGILRFSKNVEEQAESINKAAEKGVGKSESVNDLNDKVGKIMAEIQSHSNKTNMATTSLLNRSEDISRVLNVIKEIAAQTNLLALNAAIEAAGAGDAGRGFAVVAGEIRKLAENSKQSAQEIQLLIDGVQQETSTTALLVQQMNAKIQESEKYSRSAASGFSEILFSYNDTLELAEKIAESTKQQTHDLIDIISISENVVVIAEQTAAGTEEVASSSTELASGMNEYTLKTEKVSNIVAELMEQVGKFKL